MHLLMELSGVEFSSEPEGESFSLCKFQRLEKVFGFIVVIVVVFFF